MDRPRVEIDGQGPEVITNNESEIMLTTKTDRRHLTPEERQAMADLFGDCDVHEFLQCVAGLVAHNVEDFASADAAQSLIRRAARIASPK